MSDYIGDFPQDQTIYHLWPTNTSIGGSVTRATDGTLSVYKDNDETQVTTGVTDDEDFDTTTGIHSCTIVTTNVWYAPAHDYTVVLSAATIDGQTVNAPIFSFSIENRTGSPQAGAGEYTYTMYTDEDGETGEIEGVDVWITTDEAGTITIWRGVTDANGILVETAGDSKPWLDAGTYYFWRQKSGYTFSNPDTQVVV